MSSAGYLGDSNWSPKDTFFLHINCYKDQTEKNKLIYLTFIEFQKPKPPVHENPEEVRKSRKRRRPLGDVIKEYQSQNKYYMGK